MLARLHDRARQGLALPEQARPETDGPRIIALAQRNRHSQTVALIMDATTAPFAIAAHADEREAHIRGVEQFGQILPEGSYGRRNRQARETRVATRLRAVQRAYHIAIERDSALKPPEPTRELHSPAPMTDREIEL